MIKMLVVGITLMKLGSMIQIEWSYILLMWIGTSLLYTAINTIKNKKRTKVIEKITSEMDSTFGNDKEKILGTIVGLLTAIYMGGTDD